MDIEASAIEYADKYLYGDVRENTLKIIKDAGHPKRQEIMDYLISIAITQQKIIDLVDENK
ncbi:MAG: hypothetical protein AAGG00_21300 [Cyanobacteria bacterium P01_H01_bin.150]